MPEKGRTLGKELWIEFLTRWKEKLWKFLNWLLEDFSPWLKWLVFDAILTALVGILANRYKGLHPLFRALGRL
jgi:hypothetical protein